MNFLKKLFRQTRELNSTQKTSYYSQFNNKSEQINRNISGKKNEKNGDITIAIKNYEKNIAEGFVGNYPYDRLAIIYRKNKDYENEIRVLKQAIEIFHALLKTSPRQDLCTKLEKFQNRLIKAEKLKKQ